MSEARSIRITILAAVAAASGLSPVLAQDKSGPASAEIVVTGKREGAADAATETELDEQAIDDYAADSVGDLVAKIAPLIDGSDDPPVLIVNGQRIADPRDIRGYPPEALQRVEILSRDAAGRYGYAPGKRVVNLVLKREFKGTSGEFGASAPTALGRDSETLNVRRVAIAGSARWNFEASLKRESLLFESDRAVPPLPGGASIVGNVYALGAELDPRLSAWSGVPVVAAAVPADAALGPLSLQDFLPGAGLPEPRDDGDDRSLEPATRTISLNAGMTRPVGSVSLSVSLRAQSNRSRTLLGLPSVEIDLPAGSSRPSLAMRSWSGCCRAPGR